MTIVVRDGAAAGVTVTAQQYLQGTPSTEVMSTVTAVVNPAGHWEMNLTPTLARWNNGLATFWSISEPTTTGPPTVLNVQVPSDVGPQPVGTLTTVAASAFPAASSQTTQKQTITGATVALNYATAPTQDATLSPAGGNGGLVTATLSGAGSSILSPMVLLLRPTVTVRLALTASGGGTVNGVASQTVVLLAGTYQFTAYSDDGTNWTVSYGAPLAKPAILGMPYATGIGGNQIFGGAANGGELCPFLVTSPAFVNQLVWQETATPGSGLTCDVGIIAPDGASYAPQTIVATNGGGAAYPAAAGVTSLAMATGVVLMPGIWWACLALSNASAPRPNFASFAAAITPINSGNSRYSVQTASPGVLPAPGSSIASILTNRGSGLQLLLAAAAA